MDNEKGQGLTIVSTFVSGLSVSSSSVVMNDLLKQDIAYLPGVGPKRAEVLKKEIEVENKLDLLQYFPYRYVDRSRFYTTREIHAEMPYVQLRGYIRRYEEVGNGRQRRLTAIFSDEYGSIELVWFKGYRYIEQLYPAGAQYIIFGKPVLYRHGFNIAHPEIDRESSAERITGGLMPMYNTTDAMKRAGLHSRKIQELVFLLLKSVKGHLEETLPEDLIKRYGLMPYTEAITLAHFPRNSRDLEYARARLKFEELFYLQLKLVGRKHKRKTVFQGEVFEQVGNLFNTFYHKHLPFELTNAQKRVLREIRRDTLSGHQMNRLVQGDVGSGKTMVALLSMLLALDNGCQAAMMAPTEILAQQHYEGLSELLGPLGIEVALLTGSTTKTQRQKLLPRLLSGEAPIVVGTHALLEPTVRFKRLGLAVIDEQHRFGVEQRAKLWIKNLERLPHVLIMSATPIPRTLAMTLYGDLDVSVIDELPPGRKPILTLHRYSNDIHTVFDFLHRQLQAGRQAYVVFPMIEGSEKDDYKNLEEGYELYSAVFGSEKVGWVHGKMNARDKAAAMAAFVSGKKRILLATTVIEVGVNVPNATVMIIEDAGRFGLSQLHQLRGRVGRGAEQSYCILITDTKSGSDAKKRIEVMCETNDGFVVAEEDMRQRGFGEIEGTRQSGRELTLKIANPATDAQLVALARHVAEEVISEDPKLSLQKNSLIREHLQYLNRHTDEDYRNIS